jgi:hypothetical protein
MSTISKHVDPDANITVYTVEGRIHADEIVDEITRFYKGDVTLNVLWDLSNSDVKDLTADQVRTIAHIPREKADKRKGGKTAIVAPVDMTFGLSRMYGSLTESNGYPFETHIFRHLTDACTWLGYEKA